VLRRRFVIAAVVFALAGTFLFAQSASAAVQNPVTGLTATPLSASSVRLDWTNPVNADFAGVRICRSVGTTVPALPCNGPNVFKPAHTYIDSFQLFANTQYTYAVYAISNSLVPSTAASVTVTTPHAPPPGNVTALSATPLSAGSVQLDWTNPTSAGFIGVRICRAVGAVAPTMPCPAVNVPAPTHTLTDTFLLFSNTQYTYTVFAVNSAGATASGTSVTVTTLQAPAPGNVTGLTGSPASPGSIVLNWTNPTDSNFIGVRICRATGSVAPTLPCNAVNVPAPQHTVTDTFGLVADTQYTYTVFAYNSSGVASSGTSVTVTTLPLI
jgi:hypothetical protein